MLLSRINSCVLIFCFYFFNSCSGQTIETHSAEVEMKGQLSPIYGRWKCVLTDYKGYQKFTLEQAEAIKRSTLIIEKNKMYYEGLKFIELCTYDTLMPKKYDTSEFGGSSFEYKYSKKELSKMIQYDQLDKNGEWSCYNECAQLFLKQDTLINLCGGYTYYLTKVYDRSKEFSGEGTSNQELQLNGSVEEVKINYTFYSDPDELIVEDQSGRILYQTGMGSNATGTTTTVSTKGVKLLTFKIKASASKSRWKLNVAY